MFKGAKIFLNVSFSYGIYCVFWSMKGGRVSPVSAVESEVNLKETLTWMMDPYGFSLVATQTTSVLAP